MSGNAPVNASGNSFAKKTDRRVLRTRDTLGDALIGLMQEMPFDDITVQQVLDRAGVGRSTFYAHYSDKADLFLSDAEDFFEMFSTYLTRTNADLRRLAPVSEFFSHIADARKFYTAMVASGKANDVLALGQGFFARAIEKRLQPGGFNVEQTQLAAKSHALAGALFALLDWWVDHGMKPSPEEMDAIFHQLAWNGLQPAIASVNAEAP